MNQQINEEKKWQFCPEKRCYRCKRNIEQDCKSEDIVTGCPRCNRSYIE